MVNFTCHCDTVHDKSIISGDYPGEMRRILKEHYGQDTAILFLQGPCGDINHIDFFNTKGTDYPERYLEMGRALAEETIKILGSAEKSKSQDVCAITRDYALPAKQPGAEQLTWAEKIMDRIHHDPLALGFPDADEIDGEITESYGVDVSELYFAKKIYKAHKEGLKYINACLQVLKIGDLGIFASPGELFSVYGDDLIAKSPFSRTFVTAYANAFANYILPPELYTDGIYEARQTLFEPNGGALMNEELLRLGRTIS